MTLFENPKSHVQEQDWEKGLISLLRYTGPMSAKEIAEYWEVTVRTARNRLNSMLERHKIKKLAKSSTDPDTKYTL